MRVTVRAAAVVLIAGFANSEPCGSAVNMTVANREDADNLSQALLCEGEGKFEVVWNGTVQIARSMTIGNGSFLNVTGMRLLLLLSPRSSGQRILFCPCSSTSRDGRVHPVYFDPHPHSTEYSRTTSACTKSLATSV